MVRRKGLGASGRRAWWLGTAALAVFMAPLTAQSLTLREAIDLAIRTHPTVLATVVGQRIAEQGIDSARGGFFPTIDLRLGPSLADTNNSSTRGRATRRPESGQSDFFVRGESSLSLTQNVYDGHETRNRVTAAESRASLAGFRVFDSGETIGLRATNAYMDVVRDRRLVDLATANLAKHKEVVGQIKMQVDAGTATQADHDQATARAALADSVRTQFTGRLRDSEARYIEANGDMPDTLTAPEPDAKLVPDTSELVVQQAVANHPALKAARDNIAATQADQDATEAPFIPKVTFELRGSRNENAGGVAGSNNDVTAGVFVTYNLGSSGSRVGKSNGECGLKAYRD